MSWAQYYATHSEQIIARARERYRENPDKQMEWQRQYRAESAARRHAHDAVSNAIRRGHLSPKPCEMCGSSNAHAHHDDYSRPLDVRWLCRHHHKLLHAQLRHEKAEAAR